MQLAAIFLALAALGGLTIAAMRFAGVPRPPTWIALGHGTIAAIGLLLLIIAALSESLPTLAYVSLGVFVLAALGGATMFSMFHLRQLPLPIPLMLAHGATAITGFVLLLLAMYG